MNFDGDLLDFDFCEAADVDIGGIGDDLDLMTGYSEIEKKPEIDDISTDLRKTETKNVRK